MSQRSQRLRRSDSLCTFFFFHDPATTEIYTLSLHDALPILLQRFLRNPVEQFFAWRLKAFLREEQDSIEDDEPFALDGLERYQLSQWLLQQTLVDGGATWEQQLSQAAARLQARGQLPLAGFGSLAQQQIIGPLREQLERYSLQRQQWDQPLEQPLILACSDAIIQLTGALGQVRSSSSRDGLTRLVLTPGKLLDEKGKLRWSRLMSDWCLHVLAAASGHEVRSCLVGANGTVEMAPLDPQRAEDIVVAWLSAWREGMRRPLPVALETAFAYLCAREDQAEQRARECYQGSGYSVAEVQRSPALQRTHADFASLWATGEFEHWARQLYQPLVQAGQDRLLEYSMSVEESA